MKQIPKKVYVVNGSSAYYNMFKSYRFELIEDLSDDLPDLVCFTGGEDVSPSLYGELKHPTTYSHKARDDYESKVFDTLVEAKIPMVGICRGGQFLNVKNGGKMYQNVTNHTQSHFILDVVSNKSVYVTSTHHQMMIPGPSAKVVAIANQHSTKESVSKHGDIIIHPIGTSFDTEVVFYPHTQSLCFQPHPEFYGDSEMRRYFFDCIETYLGIGT